MLYDVSLYNPALPFKSFSSRGTGEEECPAEWCAKSSRLCKGTDVELQRRRRRIDQLLVFEARRLFE